MPPFLTFILASCSPNTDMPQQSKDTSSIDAAENNPNVGSDGGEDDQGTTDCEATSGTVSGQMLYELPWEGSPRPAPHAHVNATPSNDENITISSDAEGYFTAILPADDYLLTAYDTDGCVSDQTAINLTACDSKNLTLRLTECLDGIRNNNDAGQTTTTEEEPDQAFGMGL